MLALGCDVGSLFTKLVLIEEERLVAHRILTTSGTIGDELEGLIDGLLTDNGHRRDELDALGATGRGADLVPGATFRDDEVHCVAAAVNALLPEARVVLHIGGQSLAVIDLDEGGEVSRFYRNDKCAAGTGRFLEMMGRKLEVNIDELDALVGKASTPTPLSNQCVVYAESEAISHLNDGATREDLFAGIIASVARMTIPQARRVAEPRKPFVVTGGVGRLESLAELLEASIDGARQRFPLDPMLAPALGAALLDEELDEGQS